MNTPKYKVGDIVAVPAHPKERKILITGIADHWSGNKYYEYIDLYTHERSSETLWCHDIDPRWSVRLVA